MCDLKLKTRLIYKMGLNSDLDLRLRLDLDLRIQDFWINSDSHTNHLSLTLTPLSRSSILFVSLTIKLHCCSLLQLIIPFP